MSNNKERFNSFLSDNIQLDPRNTLSHLFNEYKNMNQIQNDDIIQEDDNINNNSKHNNIIQRSQTVVFNNNLLFNNFIKDLDIKNDDNFCEIIITKLKKIKEESVSKFTKYIHKFNICYEDYIIKIKNFFSKKEYNISKLNETNEKTNNLLKYAIKNIFNKINDLDIVYENIINNIEKNFELLNKFLEQTELINQKYPIEYFLSKNYKNIIECSIINHFDFNEIDIFKIRKNNYYNYYLNYLKEEKNNSIVSYTLSKNEIKKGLQFIQENYNNLKKLEIQGIDSKDLKDILDNIVINQKKNNSNILKKINVKDFDLTTRVDNLGIIKFNRVEKVKFKSGKYLNDVFLSNLFLNKTKNLISLTLEKINMSNIGLNKLMEILPNFFNTLEYISLAHNCISAVKKDIFTLKDNKNKNFEKLKLFNLYKNKIYKFEISLKKFPNLKVLDLSSNSILTDSIMNNMIKEKNKVVLFNDNLFISNNSDNNDKYIQYLNERLPNIDTRLKVLHLSFTYDEEKQLKIKELKLSPSIKVSLIKLDLSFCGLQTDIVISFLKNNFGLFSLKNLNLKYNIIKSDIFQKILCDDIILENLNSFDLSQNIITCEKYNENESLVNFIKKHQNLEKLKLIESYFFKSWNMNITPEQDIEEKFKNLYKDLVKDLKINKRRFMFIIDEESWNYVEQEFNSLFSFQEV